MSIPRAFNPITVSAVNTAFLLAQVKHDGNTPANPEMPNGERLAVLVEEVGEVARALCDGLPTKELVGELLQVAAVALAWCEGVDR